MNGDAVNPEVITPVFAVAFAILFIGMWLAITTIICFKAGWFALQRQFPDPDERALRTFRFQSAAMGRRPPANLGNILTFAACPTGLRVSIWRLFGPFVRPFHVPWNKLRAEPANSFLQGPRIRLVIDQDEAHTLVIDGYVWDALNAARPGGALQSSTVIETRNAGMARTYLLQWAFVTLFFGSISLFNLSQAEPADPWPLRLALAYGPPAAFFGLITTVRYLILRGRR